MRRHRTDKRRPRSAIATAGSSYIDVNNDSSGRALRRTSPVSVESSPSRRIHSRLKLNRCQSHRFVNKTCRAYQHGDHLARRPMITNICPLSIINFYYYCYCFFFFSPIIYYYCVPCNVRFVWNVRRLFMSYYYIKSMS